MLNIMKKILPDAYDLLLKRNEILKVIQEESPIGRRLLAEKVNLTERTIRNEIKILKKQKLISTTRLGMYLTDEGMKTLEELVNFFDEVFYLTDLEEKLAEFLDIETCTIVPGNLDQDQEVLSIISDKTVEVMDKVLGEGKQTITVMGGTTLKEVANHMTPRLGINRELLFVPARGGLGDDARIESNIIAQKMADQTTEQSHGLYAPEHVQKEIRKELLKEPDIKKTLELIEKASLVLYSIGRPIIMAKRRGLSEETIDYLKEKRAVAEAFGEFINADGDVVLKLPNIGLQSSALSQIKNIITVAAGKEKALAIASYIKTAPSHTWLITDAAAAKEILNG
ncbi:MAG: HTH domain-containing protein [Atopostipes sp.]|nr:HTH domain-containing protein [Atopostipes sp.]